MFVHYSRFAMLTLLSALLMSGQLVNAEGKPATKEVPAKQVDKEKSKPKEVSKPKADKQKQAKAKKSVSEKPIKQTIDSMVTDKTVYYQQCRQAPLRVGEED